jgi:nitroreductase
MSSTLKEIVETRRAYRSLAPFEVTEDLIHDFADCVKLSPSCFNNQPWRFVFAYDLVVLSKLFEAMSKGNEWTDQASLIIAVFSEESLDCRVKGRNYYLFDTGMASAYLILRATEMGLVAHPIAGYDEDKVKEILDIPVNMTVITLIIMGKKMDGISPLLDEKKAQGEKVRPPRLDFDKFVFLNRFSPGVGS